MAKPIESQITWATDGLALKTEPAAKMALGWEITGGSPESPYLEHMNYLFNNLAAWSKWIVEEGLIHLEATDVTISSPSADANTAKVVQLNASKKVSESTLTGTSNQITVTPSAGAVTLSLPQNIHAAATPTFGGATINGNITVTGTVDGVDVSSFKSAYDAYVDTGSSHTWSGLTLTTLSVPMDGMTLSGSVGAAVSSASVVQRNGSNVLTTGTLTGTANQVTVTPSSGAVTFSLPQNIHTAASPTFAGMTLTAFSGVVKASAGVLSAATLVNADVSASAAIDGSKISPNFAAQNVVTSGSMTSSNISAGAYLNQDARTTAAPTFAGITLSNIAAASSSVNVLQRNGANAASETVLTGTSNQITVTPSAGAVTFSLPQNIHTAATPTFSKLTLSAAAADALTGSSVDTGIYINAYDTIGINQTMTIGAARANTIYIGRTGGDVFLQGTIHGTVVATNYDYLTVSSAAITGVVDNVSDFGTNAHVKIRAANSSTDAKVAYTADFLNSGTAGLIFNRPNGADASVTAGFYTAAAGAVSGEIKATPSLFFGADYEVISNSGYQVPRSLPVSASVASGYIATYDKLLVDTGITYSITGSLVSHEIDVAAGSLDVAGDVDETARYVAPESVTGTATLTTLTGTTIDGDLNYLQDISITSLKTDATKPYRIICRDANGAVVNSTDKVVYLPNGNTADRPTGDVTSFFRYDTQTGLLDIGTGTNTWQQLATSSNSMALSNKTISGDSNTVSNIAISSLKTDAAKPYRILCRDADGSVIDTTGFADKEAIYLPNASAGTKPTGDVSSLFLYNNTTGNLEIGTGTNTWQQLATNSNNISLTNKTFDVDLNTLSNVPVASLKTVIGNAGKVIKFNDSTGASETVTFSHANLSGLHQDVATTATPVFEGVVSSDAVTGNYTIAASTTLSHDNLTVGSTQKYIVTGSLVAHNLNDASNAGDYGLDVAGSVDETAAYISPQSVSGCNPLTLATTEPGAVSSSTSGAVGSAATAARADHSHDLTLPLADTEPGGVSSSTSGAVGTSTNVARQDHSHDLGAHTHTDAASGGLVVAASATQQGAVTTGVQTFAGNKTFNGFTALGSGNTAIKMKVIAGNTWAANSTNTAIDQDINVSKIISVSGRLTNSAASGDYVVLPYIGGTANVGIYLDASTYIKLYCYNASGSLTNWDTASNTYDLLITYVE